VAARRSFDIQRFVDELDRELTHASDRGLPLVAVAGLERLLELLLSAAVPKSRDPGALFGANGPLQTVADKTITAHTLGLIPDDEKRELDLLRRVRNQMAHDLDVSFVTSEVAARCRELELGERLHSPQTMPALVVDGIAHITPDDELIARSELPLISLELPDRTQPRARFNASVHAMTKVLATRIQFRRYGGAAPESFASALELEDARVAALELAIAATPAASAAHSFESVVLRGYRYSRALIARAEAERNHAKRR
jgi:hypothetical protein